MTAIYSLPKSISSTVRFRSKPVNPHNIKVIIPTYKDWDGLRVTLESLLTLKTPPKKIVVANDNLEPGFPEWLKTYPVEIIDYTGNVGPAVARNRGFGLKDGFSNKAVPFEVKVKWGLTLFNPERKLPDYIRNGYCPELKFNLNSAMPDTFEWDSDVDWYYFTDCGCTHDTDLFLKFEKSWEEYGDSCVAISGPVTGNGNGLINEFMTEQGMLNPPLEKTVHGVYIPQAVVTANVLVAGLPFAFLGGFDPSFPEAAGEDLDLGIRLREFGLIAWSADAKVAHKFDENEADFQKRFHRYGRGNRRLEVKHQLPSLRARKFAAEKPHLQALADSCAKAMQAGYDEATDRLERGILKISC